MKRDRIDSVFRRCFVACACAHVSWNVGMYVWYSVEMGWRCVWRDGRKMEDWFDGSTYDMGNGNGRHVRWEIARWMGDSSLDGRWLAGWEMVRWVGERRGWK